MTEVNLILAIAIGLFVLYLIQCGCNMNAFKQKKKQNFENTPSSNPVTSTEMAEPVNTSNNTTQKDETEDTYQGILMSSVVDNINSTGIISSNNVNTGLLLGDDEDENVNKYKIDYRNIVENEIGQDNINSQKQYSKYIKNDNSIKYLDTDISSNYGNFYGLSLTRSSDRHNKISSTNSSQIQSIDAKSFDTNSANLRDFFGKN